MLKYDLDLLASGPFYAYLAESKRNALISTKFFQTTNTG